MKGKPRYISAIPSNLAETYTLTCDVLLDIVAGQVEAAGVCDIEGRG